LKDIQFSTTSCEVKMEPFTVAKVLRISPVRIVVIQIVIKKITGEAESKVDVMCKMTLMCHGITEKRTATQHLLMHNRSFNKLKF
jgi:hypothetical protein